MSYCYQYPRPAVTTDAIVLAQNSSSFQILLVERGIEPFRGNWALPGGFVNMDEELEDACIRELQEETSLDIAKLKQFKTYGTLNRDPRHRTISIVFYAVLDSPKSVKGGDDAANAKWFDIDQLPTLAFDHQRIIEDFIRERKL